MDNTNWIPADTASTTEQDPSEWKPGDEPMNGAQASDIETSSDEAGEPIDDARAQAGPSRRIGELQKKTGRGKNAWARRRIQPV